MANAGLLLPATLAHHLGLRELVDHHLDLGVAPGRANTGDKMLTLVSALAGGDCIDDADALRAGGTARILGGTIKAHPPWAPSCAVFAGAIRQLDRVSRELLTRLAGRRRSHHRPGLNHLRDLRGQGRGTPPRLYRITRWAVAAGTGDVLMCGCASRANTARGAAHFLRETVGLRYQRLTVRADSGSHP